MHLPSGNLGGQARNLGWSAQSVCHLQKLAASLPDEVPCSSRPAGMKGGSVLNPINALARLIGGLHDENHHVTVEGFYE